MNTHDISTEKFREYVYADGSVYRIESPLTLYSKTDERGDSHRVLDANGTTHYPVRGWKAIRWNADPAVSF